ncbi:nucleoid-associated protein [Bacteroidota bacterium]
MINLLEVKNNFVSAHFVGNKSAEEPLLLSDKASEIDEDIFSVLKNILVSTFKSSEFYNFHHDVKLDLNEVYYYCSLIFENDYNFHSQSINIAKKLYDCSGHPKIKSGEIIILKLSDCLIDKEPFDAIIILKSESKDTFLDISRNNNSFTFKKQTGISIDSIDKGCIIINCDKESGYIVSSIDNTNSGIEARYWFENFLNLKVRNDSFHKTNQMLSICKSFAIRELPNHMEISKAEQADILHRSINYFKENDNFYSDDFVNEVIQNSEYIGAFNKYKTNSKMR